MMTERDESLIQKCVDNEATAEERRELMQRLANVTDGWKILACSFVEDQLFADASCEEALSQPVPASGSRTATAASANRSHWFYHPLTSLVLSACVAFMAGILISGEMQKVSLASAENSESEVGSSVADNTSAPAADLVSDGSGYQVRIEQDGMPVRVLPVFSQKEYASKTGEFWRRMRKSRGGDVYDVREPEIQFLEFVGGDGQRYVIPVEGFPSAPRYQ